MLEKMPKCRRCEIYDPKPGVMSKQLDEDAVEHLLLLVLSILLFNRQIGVNWNFHWLEMEIIAWILEKYIWLCCVNFDILNISPWNLLKILNDNAVISINFKSIAIS